MLKLEIADSPSSHEQGLMFRKSLPDDVGMLFKFNSPQVRKFWGLNTYIPLDIAFIDNHNKIIKIDRIKPLSLKTVSSDKSCLLAIEANEGFFSSNGIKPGFTLKQEKDRDGKIIASFSKGESRLSQNSSE